MNVQKSNMKCEAVFSDDGKHRLSLKKEWDKSKPSAVIIMINPNSADTLSCDTTTMLVLNNLYKLDFGSVEILNLYSRITSKISFRFNSDEELLCTENDEHIKKASEKADIIILAWGSVGKNNSRIKDRKNAVLNCLKPFAEKLKIITDGNRTCSFHPLAPQVRSSWVLSDYVFEEVQHGEN